MKASVEKITELCKLLSFNTTETAAALKVHADKTVEEIQGMIDQMNAFRAEVARALPDVVLT